MAQVADVTFCVAKSGFTKMDCDDEIRMELCVWKGPLTSMMGHYTDRGISQVYPQNSLVKSENDVLSKQAVRC